MGLVTTRCAENSPQNCSAIVHYRSRLWMLLYQLCEKTRWLSGPMMLVICSSGSRQASLKAGRLKLTARIYVWNLSPLLGCAPNDVNLTCPISQSRPDPPQTCPVVIVPSLKRRASCYRLRMISGNLLVCSWMINRVDGSRLR